jgi:hypothetical protein
MNDEPIGRETASVRIESVADPSALASRRDFLRLVGLAGALALIPSFAVACGSDAVTAPADGIAGSGSPVLIDFAQGDVAIMQYLYVVEQLQAELYSRTVSSFASSSFTATEQAVLTEIRDHELAHRELLKATLGNDAAFAVTATFRGLTFTDRAAVLAAAKSLEDLAVAAYDGAAQYVATSANLVTLAKIVSVEARHAATIADLLQPRSNAFAPAAVDAVFRPAKVAVTLQTNLVDKLGFANAPATFVQGPAGGG